MFGSRTQRWRSLAVLVWWQEKAYQDDQKFTWEDIDETLLAVGALALIWKGDLILAAIPGINIIEGVVVAGAVASYAIGGTEGVENYFDFITEPTKIPERIIFTAETLYEHKIEEPLKETAKAYVGWIDRRLEEAKSVWSITAPRSVLPF